MIGHCINRRPERIQRLIRVHLNGIVCNIIRRGSGRILRPADKTIAGSAPVAGRSQIVVILDRSKFVVFIYSSVCYCRIIGSQSSIQCIRIVCDLIHLQSGDRCGLEVRTVHLCAVRLYILTHDGTIDRTRSDGCCRCQDSSDYRRVRKRECAMVQTIRR